MYSYSPGGLLLKKRLRVNRNSVDADLDAEWTYDNEGKLTTVRYPLGALYQHGYDEMGRPKTMVDAGTQTTIIGGALYGPAGELLGMGNETRQYNSRLQVTRITYPGQDWEYKYSATQNNGQITAMKDWTSGEEVNYAYDELKRLSSAVTVGPEWGNSYVYDGFGNLLQKNVVKGTAPYMNLSIDPATNKPYSGYTAAGLPSSGAQFDNDNRMIATTAGSSYQEYYAYSPAGKRVWNRGKRDIGGLVVDVEEVWFWGVTGQRMAFYDLTATGNPVFTLKSTNLYMGSKLVVSGGVAVKTDRLGSVGKFYPWGEERTPTGASGEKFATYYHDVQAGMNYADQRWHGTNGRFQVPDPYRKSARTGDPVTWNRYAYVGGEPINRRDRSGLEIEDWDWENCEWNGEEWVCEWTYNPGPQEPKPDVRPKGEGGREGGGGGAWMNLEAELKKQLAIISDTWKPNDECKKFLGTLGLGTSVAENLKKRTKLISFKNGLGSKDPLSRERDDGVIETKPAMEWFSDPNRHAMTPLGGTSIYWGMTFSDSSDLGKLAEVFHELLHTMSPTMSDTLLAKQLGVEIVDGKTSVITEALKTKCFD